MGELLGDCDTEFNLEDALNEIAALRLSLSEKEAALKRLEKVAEAADIVEKKIRAVFESKEFESLFVLNHIHGGRYAGPTCETKLLDDLRNALRELDSP